MAERVHEFVSNICRRREQEMLSQARPIGNRVSIQSSGGSQFGTMVTLTKQSVRQVGRVEHAAGQVWYGVNGAEPNGGGVRPLYLAFMKSGISRE